MKTLRTAEFMERVKARLAWSAAVITIGGLLAGMLLPGRPFTSALVGVAGALLIMGVSAISLSKMVADEDLGLQWLVLDYIIKIAVIAAAIAIPKAVGGFTLPLIAAIVIAALVATVVVQLGAVFAARQ